MRMFRNVRRLTFREKAFVHTAKHQRGLSGPHDTGRWIMSTKDSEVNRNIDTDTAEGHVARRSIEETLEDGKRASVRRGADGLDDEAEGHRMRG